MLSSTPFAKVQSVAPVKQSCDGKLLDQCMQVLNILYCQWGSYHQCCILACMEGLDLQLNDASHQGNSQVRPVNHQIR